MFMGDKAKLTALIALLCPLIIYCAAAFLNLKRRKALQYLFLLLYCFVIAYFTLLCRGAEAVRTAKLRPFWSYAYYSDPQYRWQIYMNVFLFIPFGFLLPLAAQRNIWQTALIGLGFSALIEAVQYLFGLGLCEFDDVFHNTLGTALGYGYWKLVSCLNGRLFMDRKGEP